MPNKLPFTHPVASDTASDSRRSSHWQPSAFALLLHVGVLTGLYSALYCFGIVNRLPTNEYLMSWDVDKLLEVANNGYTDAKQGYNAFFPLMPLVWRYTGMNLLSASLFNATLTLLGLFVLARTFALRSSQLLIIASAPLMFFTLVPYTEGFFFFFAALLLRGLHLQRLPFTLLGLLGCGLTRSAAVLFLPAYLFTELLAWGESSSGRTLLRNIGFGLLAIASSVGVVMVMQGRQHGDPFAFYKVHALWGHQLQWPAFPLFSSAGITMLWLDAAALVVGILALGGCIVLGIRWIRQRRQGTVRLGVSKAILFAMGYSVGATGFVLFSQSGDLVGASRYVMGTAFFGTLLAWAWQAPWSTAKALGGLAAAWVVVALLVGLPTRMNNFAPGEALWYFGLLGAYLSSYWFVSVQRSPWSREITTGLYCINIFFIAHLLNLFLNDVWVN